MLNFRPCDDLVAGGAGEGSLRRDWTPRDATGWGFTDSSLLKTRFSGGCEFPAGRRR